MEAATKAELRLKDQATRDEIAAFPEALHSRAGELISQREAEIRTVCDAEKDRLLSGAADAGRFFRMEYLRRSESVSTEDYELAKRSKEEAEARTADLHETISQIRERYRLLLQALSRS